MRDVFLAGESALAFLMSPLVKDIDAEFEEGLTDASARHFMSYLEGTVAFPCSVFPPDRAPALSRQEALAISEWLRVSLPLHANVAKQLVRRNSQKLQCSVHPRSVPASQYFVIDGELACALPELVLLQEASTATDIELVVLASLMFGVFTRDPSSGALIPRRKLCAPDSMVRLIDRCLESDCRLAAGADRLRKLLPWAVVNAASPSEVESGLRLGLPCDQGGCGYGTPHMNYKLAIPGTKSFRYCDLYWPDKEVAVEYDSDQEHGFPEALERDALHNNDLTSLGIPLFRLTSGLLSMISKFNRVAKQIGVALGASKIPNSALYHDAQRDLRIQIRDALAKYGF